MSDEQDQSKHSAERKKVDSEMAKKKSAKSSKSKPTAKKKTYPAGVSMMGQGFKNLYDSLGGNK
jgi:hypothetical protein